MLPHDLRFAGVAKGFTRRAMPAAIGRGWRRSLLNFAYFPLILKFHDNSVILSESRSASILLP